MANKISDELEKMGYDKKELKKFFKSIRNIIISKFNDGEERVMIDEILTIELLKYDPRKNPYRAQKNYYINYYPSAKFNTSFIGDFRYATKHMLEDDEIEYNKQVEEKIRRQKAYYGETEED